MWADQGGGTIAVVIAREPMRVVVEIERAESTIRGSVAIEGAPPSGFYGWLELIDELERASTQWDERVDDRGDRERGGEP